MAEPTRFVLPQSELPTAWFNVLPHLPEPPRPPLHPATRQPVGPDDLAPLFPGTLIEQEVTTAEWVDIPGGILDVYRLWRPTPLVRARRIEEHLGTPARIYYKDESGSPAGSHKPNTAVAQAYYNQQDGTRRLTTETGAGQWGSALAMACAFYGLECEVWMVAASYRQKPYRRVLMETWGATVHPSPSPLTDAGKRILEQDEDHPGSLGVAISEAVEAAAGNPDAHYSLGSVLNHVLLHQTVIGLEARAQLEQLGETPDVVLSCHGGGSNLGGIALPFVPLARQGRVRLLAAEPRACPTLTEGAVDYDFADTAATTPLLHMHTLGHEFVPDPIHAGGLRYHGAAPIISGLVSAGLMEAVAYDQRATFEAATTWARVMGTVVAPETAHAVRAVLDEAERARETGEETVILFNLSGHGLLDLSAYDDHLHGRLA